MKKEITLTLRNIEHTLLAYLLQRHISEGSYFGRQDQHIKMCRDLLEKLLK